MRTNNVLLRVLAPLRWVIRKLFGEIHWIPPAWIRLAGEKITSLVSGLTLRLKKAHDQNPRGFYQRCGIFALLFVAIFGSTFWYLNRPEPHKLTITGTWPKPTVLEEDKPPVVFPLVMRFSGSAAPLESVGKDVIKNFSVTPPLEGKWSWTSDTELLFAVKDDWTVGQEYTVRFEKSFFAKHVLLSDYSYKFRSPAFAASIEKGEFYENPLDAKDKKVVTTVKFTHPVDKADFEKRISVKMRVEPEKNFGGKDVKLFGFKVLYNKLGTEAYVHSEQVAIPDEEGEMLVAIEKGVRAERGGPGTENYLYRTVHIPGIENYFRIQSITGAVVKNEKFEPEHIAILDSSVGISQKNLAGSVEAFLLPVDKSAIGDKPAKKKYHWSDPKEIVAEVLAQASPLPFQWIPTEREYSPLQSFKYEADVGRYVYLKVKKGIQAFGGYPLHKDYGGIIRVAEFPQELQIMHDGAILSLTGEKKVSIAARNLETIRFSLSRLLPQTVNHLVTQSSGKFQKPEFSWNFGSDNIAEVFTHEETLPSVQAGHAQYTAFDFGAYLATGPALPRGLFLLKVSNWDPKHKTELSPSDQRLILVTDLGLLVKDSQNGSHDVFVQSINSGEPVTGAVVQVLGKNGVALFSTTTAADGHLTFPLLKDFQREKEPTVYVVEKDGDMSFLPYKRSDRQLNFSRFDTGGLYSSAETEALQGYLFTDRGIYRPGEEMHLGMIVKPTDWKPLAEGTPLEIVVSDPRGVEIRREVVRFSTDGFQEYRFQTQEASLTGTYQFSLYLVREHKRPVMLGSTSARVEEFMPDRMTIQASFVPRPGEVWAGEGWATPSALQVHVVLRNLYGTPATRHKVKGSMKLNPSYPAFAKYAGYSFFDPLRAKHSFDEVVGEKETDDNGEVDFELKLERFEKASYALQFVAEGFELEGGRSVSSVISTVVSPLPYLIAYKADGDLSYIKRNAARSVKLIAVNQALEPSATEGLSYEIVDIRYVSVLTKQSNGTLAYQSVKKETVKEKHPFQLAKEGLEIPLPSIDPGTYALIVRDKDETELNRVSYSIIGDANLSRSLERNAELQLKLNKADFSPGEEIEVEIQAPYIGAGLITIEKDKVYAFKWFKTTDTASVQRIAVPDTLDGNGYLNVSFVRGLSSKEIYMSPLSYGVVPFTVSRKRHTNDVTLSVPELVRPGETLQIGYKTAEAARLVVVAVDEGILQVARFHTPDPLAHYYRKRALEVETSQILDLILPEFAIVRELSATGGDEEGLLAKNLNPFKRKGQKPVAFWSGILPASAEEQTVSYPIPDYFNGTVRVYAVAVSDNAIGVSEKKTTVRGPFVISPNAPYFVAPDDQFEVTATVANNVEGSGADAKVSLALEVSPNLTVKDEQEKQQSIPEGKDASFSFKLQAGKSLGAGDLRFKASAGDKAATYSIDLSVRPAMPFLTTVSSGAFKNGLVTSGKQELALAREVYPDLRLREAQVSTSPLGLARGLVNYLVSFPHGCTEQIVSQAFPAIVLGAQPDFGLSEDKVKHMLSRAYLALQGRQNSEGAFSFWTAGSFVSKYQTVYATHFLLEAKERGYNPPRGLLESAAGYLAQLAETHANSIEDYREQAYAIYILTRSGQVTTNSLTALKERLAKFKVKDWEKDITALYMAATYRLLQLDKQASELRKNVSFDAAVVPNYYAFFDRLSYKAMYLYLISKHFPEELKQFSTDSLLTLTDEIVAGNFNTLSSSLTILALDTYGQAAGQATGGANLSIAEVYQDETVSALTLPNSRFPFVALSEKAKKVRFAGDSSLPLFYQLTEAGFDIALPLAELKNRLEVYREYHNEKGEVVMEAKLGDNLEEHLILRSLNAGDQYLPNISVIDLIPGGCEIDINASHQSLRTEKDTWTPTYVDIREDRALLYGDAGTNARRFIYRLKATNRGEFTVPPIFAESMYDRRVQAWSLGGKFVVK